MQSAGLPDSVPKPTSRLRNLLRPDLSNDFAALTACRSASVACLVIAGWDVFLSLFISDYRSLVGASLLFLIGLLICLGLRKAWRTAAIAGFAFQVGEAVWNVAIGLDLSILLGVFIVIMMLFAMLILFNGVRGSFLYQKLRRIHQPPPLPMETNA